MESILTAILIVFFVLLVSSTKFVKANEVLIIERFGKFYKKAEPGVVILIPCIDKIKISLPVGTQTIYFKDLQLVDKDNVALNLDVRIAYSILDARKAAYAVQSLNTAIEYLAKTAITDIVAKNDTKTCIESKVLLTVELSKIIEKAIGAWGCDEEETEIEDIRRVNPVNY